MRKILGSLVIAFAVVLPTAARSQATARSCDTTERVGPACLLAHQAIAALPQSPVYWHLDQFPSRDAAAQAAAKTSVVVEAFGSTWLFTLESRGWRARGSNHSAIVGPLAVKPAATYAAEYLRSVFNPGMTAPLHVHSGPEAFYAVSGDTCLETPEGVQFGRGDGNSLTIRSGPPMLLMAIGREQRKGFALILHDASMAPTTLTEHWQPSGLCSKQLSEDRGH